MDVEHLWTAARYVELNPERAGLAGRAEEYPWSSAAAHCGVRAAPLLSRDVPSKEAIEFSSLSLNYHSLGQGERADNAATLQLSYGIGDNIDNNRINGKIWMSRIEIEREYHLPQELWF